MWKLFEEDPKMICNGSENCSKMIRPNAALKVVRPTETLKLLRPNETLKIVSPNETLKVVKPNETLKTVSLIGRTKPAGQDWLSGTEGWVGWQAGPPACICTRGLLVATDRAVLYEGPRPACIRCLPGL